MLPACDTVQECKEKERPCLGNWKKGWILNPDKTEAMVTGRPCDLGHQSLMGFSLLFTEFHSLDVLPDPLLHLDLQVAAMTRNAYQQLHLGKRLWPFLLDSDLTTTIHAFVTWRLDYSNASTWDCLWKPSGYCSQYRTATHPLMGMDF